jgi:hypothetical protein
MVTADDAVRASPEFQTNRAASEEAGRSFFAVRVPLERALGPNHQSMVKGVEREGPKGNPTGWHAADFSDGTVQAVYRRDHGDGSWRTWTIYPRTRQEEDTQ